MTTIKHDGCQVATMTITPEIARTWLAVHNHGNRPTMPATLARYTRAMAAGRWAFVGDPIRFSTDGRLLDGQHRLQAIVDSSTTQVMLVLHGCEDADQRVMDAGAPRRPGQQLGMDGWTNGNIVSSIVRMVVRWQTDTLTTNNFNPSTDETIDFANRYRPRLEAATQIAIEVHNATRLKRPALGAVAFKAFDYAGSAPERLSPDTVREFFELVRTGEALTAGHPILALRAHALRSYGVKTTFQPEASAVYYIARTWNAWRTNKQMAKLQLPPGGAVTPAHLKLI